MVSIIPESFRVQKCLMWFWDTSSFFLEKLHWITFKSILLLHTNSASHYLCEFLMRHDPFRTLRSANALQNVSPSRIAMDSCNVHCSPYFWSRLQCSFIIQHNDLTSLPWQSFSLKKKKFVKWEVECKELWSFFQNLITLNTHSLLFHIFLCPQVFSPRCQNDKETS